MKTDMSSKAVTERLKKTSELRRLCLALRTRPLSMTKSAANQPRIGCGRSLASHPSFKQPDTEDGRGDR